ncbi:hypothetical protein PHET_01875 [Paragonimus heterotremus]|uniref:Uncharacterized protein n=1 Tax=Paragonimus heterotremus TaxID=100268 RepID=A0A8J4X2T2_9TREM|nr:hypothetical protein PHET_01875 [Paragonimus heterotremus]
MVCRLRISHGIPALVHFPQDLAPILCAHTPRSHLRPRAGIAVPGLFIVTVLSDGTVVLGVVNWGTRTTSVNSGTLTVVPYLQFRVQSQIQIEGGTKTGW